MAKTDVQYDGQSIQTDNIILNQIDHESLDYKELNSQRLGNTPGGKLVDIEYRPRVIRISGTIIGTSKSDLETRLDNLKLLCNRQEKNLDIQYLTDYRRYKVTQALFAVTRQFFHINHVDFEIEFLCSRFPFGIPRDTSTVEFLAKTVGTFEGTTGVLKGTYEHPMPKIKMTINSATNLTKIYFENQTTGGSITIERDFSAGEELIIDPTEQTVRVDGVAVDFSGVFSEFNLSNDFKVIFTSTSHDVDVKLIYYPMYL